MSATNEFFYVHVFSNKRSTVAKIDTRDTTFIGPWLPADNKAFLIDEPVRLSTNDVAQMVAQGISGNQAKKIGVWALALTWALDFVARYSGIIVDHASGSVAWSMSPHVIAAMVYGEIDPGTTYKAFWNSPLRGVLDASVLVGYADADNLLQANWLN